MDEQPSLSLNLDAQLVAATVLAHSLVEEGITDPDQLSDVFFEEMADLTAEGHPFPDMPTKPVKTHKARPRDKIRPCLEELEETTIVSWTRFTYGDLVAVAQALEIPDPFRTSQRDVFSAVEALAILCNRFSWPSRQEDLADRWSRDTAQISRVTNELSHFLYDTWGFLLTEMPSYTPDVLERYASATTKAGCPADNVAFFLDSTFLMVDRPGEDQRPMYSGYKKGHGYKFQGLVAPDGLLIQSHGPIEGSRGDNRLLEVSGLSEALVQCCHGYGRRQIFAYADPAYGQGKAIFCGLKQVQKLSPLQQEFNTMMSKFRESIEWAFNKVKSDWEFLDHKQNLKIFLSPVAVYFQVAVLLTNARTICYGSQVSRYFKCPPPQLAEYFRRQVL